MKSFGMLLNLGFKKYDFAGGSFSFCGESSVVLDGMIVFLLGSGKRLVDL